MNVYDSDRMRDLLLQQCGLTITDNPQQADVLLMNTCSIREKAQEKVFSELGRWRPLKQHRPHLVIGVGGCVASQEGEAIVQRAPFVDLVFGPQTLHRLPQMLQAVWAQQGTQVDIRFPEIEKFDHLPVPQANGVEAFVSVMEGCSKYCSFCVVPYTRGEEVSRPVDDILEEVTALAAQGVREVNLLGQNVNAYRGHNRDGAMADLAELIVMVAAIEGIDRIRYTTSHPIEFSDALIAVYAHIPQLVDHLHLPLQSAADAVLAAMKRGHTYLEYKSRIRRLRKIRPNISLSSDFIVGFPGETNADFAATMDSLSELHFDYSFSFIYSKRPGTPAAMLADPISQEEKRQRLQLLQQRITAQSYAISRQMVGSEQMVLVSDFAKKDPGQLQGRTENNRIVNFSCTDPGLIGHFVKVQIQEALPNSLRGELITVVERPFG